MRTSKTKVAVIGCGLVGSTTAFSLITQGVCDEVLMIDVNKERALGETMDLQHCIEYLNRNAQIITGDYADCEDADIIVITAGAPPKPGQSRNDTLEMSAKIVESIVQPIRESGFDGIFVVVSNPVDIIAHYIYELSGLPKNQIIGTGTALDSARLKTVLGEVIHVDPRSVQAFTMGEHGDTQMCPWSAVSVGGKPLYELLEDNKERFQGVDLEEILHFTSRVGFEILNRKGTTYYGIATTCVAIIHAILFNENKVIPVSTLLEGEYGVNGVFAGVPAIINRQGVKEVVEIHMTAEELERFHQSTEFIRENQKAMRKRV